MTTLEGEDIMTKRQQQAEETKNRISLAAKKLFFENGYTTVTIDEICKECDVTKGAFYHHFASKDEVFFWAYRLEEDRYLNEKLENSMSSENIKEQLMAYFGAMTEFKKENFELFKQYYRIMLTMQNVMEILEQREMPNHLFSIFERGKEKKILKEEFSVEYCMNLFISSITGVYMQWGIFEGSYNVDMYIENVIDSLYQNVIKKN